MLRPAALGGSLRTIGMGPRRQLSVECLHCRSGAQWKTAVAIASIVDAKLTSSNAPHALFFHAARVSPAWHATRVAAIGNHIFYR